MVNVVEIKSDRGDDVDVNDGSSDGGGGNGSSDNVW